MIHTKDLVSQGYAPIETRSFCMQRSAYTCELFPIIFLKLNIFLCNKQRMKYI